MTVEQQEPSAQVVAEFERSILESMCSDPIERHFQPRQRRGIAASRRARVNAALLADVQRLAREARAGMEGAGE